jgi:D-alanyl-D-alanine carboxypeptidase
MKSNAITRVGVLVVFSLAMGCSPSADAPLEMRLQQILDEGIHRSDAPGVSAAIVFPDNTLWTGASGVSHDNVAVLPDMFFGIGSITKNVVAALTLKLVEQGVLSLEDPLSQWLPEHRHVDPQISVRQLLNHTSGLSMFWDNDDLWQALKADRSRRWRPEEVLSYIGEPYFVAGARWRYSNTNYLLLAMILTRATGSTLSAELRRQLWQPLGIEDAYLILEDTLPDNLAHVYGDDFQFGPRDRDLTFEPRDAHESITWGSSGLFMTAEALARWCQALFSGEVLSQESMDAMLDFVEFRPVANMRAYGLGVQVFEKSFASGELAIGHGGGNIGTATYMVFLPDHRMSIVVMVNAYPTDAVGAMTKELIRTLLRDVEA